MKPLTIDQQIQVSRVLGWISLMVEGTASVRAQHQYIAQAAKELCPILNLEEYKDPIDSLWELGGLPEDGLATDAETEALKASLTKLAEPLRRASRDGKP